MSKELKHRLLESEKSIIARSSNQLVFITSKLVTKVQLKSFLESKYEIEIIKINSILYKGKTKIRKRIKVDLPDKKKFYVTVKNGLDKFNKVDQNNA